jgi:hypothetical protein
MFTQVEHVGVFVQFYFRDLAVWKSTVESKNLSGAGDNRSLFFQWDQWDVSGMPWEFRHAEDLALYVDMEMTDYGRREFLSGKKGVAFSSKGAGRA